jgi:FkbM family methyltransferase
MIEVVLSTEEMLSDPPVLLDIGAAGGLHHKWKPIAPYSVCIAFDADQREMVGTDESVRDYRQLHIFNSIVTASLDTEVGFSLTRSPFCSSTLEPDRERLRQWQFADLFDVQREAKVKAANLESILTELKFKQVDWVKIDSQGTDMRLLLSLGSDLVKKIMIAELEPGIIDAYRGEDKLHKALSLLDELPFWVSDLRVQGSQRLNADFVRRTYGTRTLGNLTRGIPIAPGWAEATFINTFPSEMDWTKRDILLGWVFAMTERQYGFALELADLGRRSFEDRLFAGMESHTLQCAARAANSTRFRALPRSVYRRFAGKFGRT